MLLDQCWDGIQPQEQADKFKVCFCKQQEVTIIPRQDDLEQKFKEFCNMEFTEKLSETADGLSVDDKRFMDIMEQSTTKQGDHYQMDLPLRERNISMPNNKNQAKGFARRLSEKLSKNEEMHQQYTTFMDDLENQGYAERVPEVELNRNYGKTWYIPHHGVYHPQKPGKTGYQKMAELPRSRVQGDEPAITRVGMDYFGPFEIKCGRSVIRKKYGVIFTCLASRAVHIEVASSLDTSSCIDAIRRFISRRGHVKEMFSDNGTNLVGAERELKQALKELNQDQGPVA